MDTNDLVEFEGFYLINEETSEGLKLMKREEENEHGAKKIYYLLIRCPLNELGEFTRIEIPILRKYITVDSDMI